MLSMADSITICHFIQRTNCSLKFSFKIWLIYLKRAIAERIITQGNNAVHIYQVLVKKSVFVWELHATWRSYIKGKKAEENIVRDYVCSSTPVDSVNKKTIVNSLEVFHASSFYERCIFLFQKVEWCSFLVYYMLILYMYTLKNDHHNKSN